MLRTVDRKNSRPVQKRSSLTSACLGKNISDGNELTSALSACSRNVFSPTPCFICNPPIVLRWCLTKQNRSAVPVVPAEMAVLI